VVSAVLAEQGHDPARAAATARDLAELVKMPDWPEVLIAYARCKRIVRNLTETYPLASALYTEEATKGLYEAWQIANCKPVPSLCSGQALSVAEGSQIANGKPVLSVAEGSQITMGVMQLDQILRELREPINRFFTDVLVMAEDPAVRQARLALVQRIAALPDGIADLGQLQGF
jgi:glycyl-tRNA synthetase beta subunit